MSIDEASTCFASASVGLACGIRGRGSIVDQNCPPTHARKRAFVTKHNAAQIIVVSDADEDDLFSLCCIARSFRRLATKLFRSFRGFGGGAVVYGNLMSNFTQMACHGISHNTQSDECYFHNFVSPVGTPINLVPRGGRGCLAKIAPSAHTADPTPVTADDRRGHRHALRARLLR